MPLLIDHISIFILIECIRTKFMSEIVIEQKNPILNSLLLYLCESYSKIEDNLILF